jgi:hypothetical protein
LTSSIANSHETLQKKKEKEKREIPFLGDDEEAEGRKIHSKHEHTR